MPDELPVRILHGEPLDKQLRHEVEVLRDCLTIAVQALAFDKSPATVQAVRTIAARLRDNGMRQMAI